MEIELANEINRLNINSLTLVKDWIKNGYIPDWLLEELLIRLPPKVVFRLKLVSKQWHSIILDPSFVKTYWSRALSLQKFQPWAFISSYRYFGYFDGKYNPDCKLLVDMYSSKLKRSSLYVLSLPSFPHPHEKGYRIYEVSNGLVLYGPQELTDEGFRGSVSYRICNPVTGQWIALCQSSSQYNYNSWGFMTNVEDGVLLSYAVVRLYLYVSDNFLTSEVFLSEVGEWKKYVVPINIANQFVFKSSSAVINGVMHWMFPEHGLIAYDPRKRPDHIRIIALPGEPIIEQFYHICTEYQGTLRYFRVCGKSENIFRFRSFSIWVLKDYSSDDWSLQHRVIYDDIQMCWAISDRNLLLLKPLAFHPYDPDIVYVGFQHPSDPYMVVQKLILSYNIKTKRLEVPEDFRPCGKISSWLCTYFFKIPPWPLSLSRTSIRASED